MDLHQNLHMNVKTRSAAIVGEQLVELRNKPFYSHVWQTNPVETSLKLSELPANITLDTTQG